MSREKYSENRIGTPSAKNNTLEIILNESLENLNSKKFWFVFDVIREFKKKKKMGGILTDIK